MLTTLEQAHRRDLDIHLEMAPLPAQPFDRDDMLEVLGNVLDNAFKWANHRVRVAVTVVEECGTDSEQRKQLALCVEDDGPGIQMDRREQVLQRGQRLDERAAGHGLGLSIVSDTMAAYGGELVLDESALGGLRICLHFPHPQ